MTPLQMSVAKNAIKFLQAQHAIDLYNVKKDLLISRFEIFNLKNYVKHKTIQQMHNAIAKKIKFQPNFLRKSMKVFLPMSRMEFQNLFLPDVDFRQFLDAKRSNFSCEISIAHATYLGLYVPEMKILHPLQLVQMGFSLLILPQGVHHLEIKYTPHIEATLLVIVGRDGSDSIIYDDNRLILEYTG